MEVKKSPKADLENKKSIFLQMGLCVSLLLVIWGFSTSQKEVQVMVMENTSEIIEMEIIEITREEQKPPEVRQQQVQVTSDILNIVRDDKKIDASLTFADFDQDVDFSFQPVTGTGTEEVVADDEPFMQVEEMPMFQGQKGDVAFRAWVQKNVSYPTIAAENGIQGRVIVSFVVERDGSVSNIQILSSPDRSLSDAATKTVSSSPKWTPGKQRGVPVRVRYNLPVDFKLQ